MRIGLLPLGRATFDVAYAENRLQAMLRALNATGHELVGSRDLLMDEDATATAVRAITDADVDRVLILQVTFTDAVAAVDIAAAFDQPLAIWAPPEPRLGGRLRLNAFCGLNLAAHALKKRGRRFGWLYADPDGPVGDDLALLLAATDLPAAPRPQPVDTEVSVRARSIVDGLRGLRIGRIGEHPPGFDTCAYDADALQALCGVAVEPIDLDTLFERARAVPGNAVEGARTTAAAVLDGLDAVDQEQLERSLRFRPALDHMAGEGGFDAFAIRCWPETFTAYGGAVCGAVGMSVEDRRPCACEADVYGALTQLVLQKAADQPVFLADLVDLDRDDGTGVVWHCGQAPASMRDPDVAATATVHTNRKMPLLFEFPLRPGRVTVLRVSQAFGEPAFVLAGGEMLKRPMAFTGTSGVVRFDRPAGAMLDDVIASGLEHHTALAYGEHRPLLREVAAALGLPVLELTS